MDSNMSLAESFQQYFSVELAHTPEQKQRVYQIRYRVYCEEFKYEPADHFPDEEEYDDYDDTSIHCLITHKSSGEPAGCVRMVPTTGVDYADLLPYERYCGSCIDQDFIAGLNIKRQTHCEISRLAVDGTFRRRAGERATRFGELEAMSFTPQERRMFPLISVAGFLASTALTELTGRTNVIAMMEPFLPKLLKRSGIIFERAGRDIDYHGTRAPYFITTQSAIDGMRADLKGLYDDLYANIKLGYDKSLAESAE
jgi:N-acyl amino acid synthase of PEP-CTERM/exosortase system